MAVYFCPDRPALLISCEHAGNLIPVSLRHLFAGEERMLDSHFAHDPGALETAVILARSFRAPLYYTLVSRLVVDCNRSPASRHLFSRFTEPLGEEGRERLAAEYHRPYHNAIGRTAARLLAGRPRLIHLAVHSFTPELHGRTRNADIGLLYDPGRQDERRFCGLWREKLLVADPGLRVRRNYPYLGITDGLPTRLRKEYPDGRYLGIELEINQLYANRPESLAAALAGTLNDILADPGWLFNRRLPVPAEEKHEI